MKNAIRFLGLLALMFISAYGYSQTLTDEERAQQMTDRMQTQIGFDNETAKAVYDINLDFAKKAIACNNERAQRQDRLRSTKRFDDDRSAQLKQVLSEEEYQLFLENRSENRRELRERGHGHGGNCGR